MQLYQRHSAARYQGSLPEHHGQIGCLMQDDRDPSRSKLVLWHSDVTLRGVRRESLDGVIEIDPSVPCPCGQL